MLRLNLIFLLQTSKIIVQVCSIDNFEAVDGEGN